MKTSILLGLLLLLLSPAGHSAHHQHHYPAGRQPVCPNRLLPLRVLRTPAVAEQHRLVRPVNEQSATNYPNE